MLFRSGTMNPFEHGEVFVLDDGGEVDMDFGHYERYLGVTCKSKWNLTMGKVFDMVRQKERRGDYLGKTVQYIPHVTEVIKSHVFDVARGMGRRAGRGELARSRVRSPEASRRRRSGVRGSRGESHYFGRLVWCLSLPRMCVSARHFRAAYTCAIGIARLAPFGPCFAGSAYGLEKPLYLRGPLRWLSLARLFGRWPVM